MARSTFYNPNICHTFPRKSIKISLLDVELCHNSCNILVLLIIRLPAGRACSAMGKKKIKNKKYLPFGLLVARIYIWTISGQQKNTKGLIWMLTTLVFWA